MKGMYQWWQISTINYLAYTVSTMLVPVLKVPIPLETLSLSSNRVNLLFFIKSLTYTCKDKDIIIWLSWNCLTFRSSTWLVVIVCKSQRNKMDLLWITVCESQRTNLIYECGIYVCRLIVSCITLINGNLYSLYLALAVLVYLLLL